MKTEIFDAHKAICEGAKLVNHFGQEFAVTGLLVNKDHAVSLDGKSTKFGDLFLAVEPEGVWVNMYSDGGPRQISGHAFSTKEEADKWSRYTTFLGTVFVPVPEKDGDR